MAGLIWLMMLAAQTGDDPSYWNRRGEDEFRAGNAAASVAAFDRVLALRPSVAPQHWQRGISLYYAGRFDDCRRQFELHRTVNPEDVENAVWHYLCVARLKGPAEARKGLIPIRDDERIPMMEVHALFKGDSTVEKVLAKARTANPPEPSLFYGHLYAGLYLEAQGDAAGSLAHIKTAAQQYAAGHYMWDVARVHWNLRRVNQHRVTSARSPAQQPGAENVALLSLVDGLKTREDWIRQRRPRIHDHWLKMLGKVEPNKEDLKWFGDIRQARVVETTELEKYTRIKLELPMEKDFYQPHLLLLPKGQGKGPFPTVIAWTSSTPDYQEPEKWWGSWLASRGYVVLTGWSFIRNYRDGSNYSRSAHEKVYERFGHWLAMGKMVHDVKREVEYLKSRREVDAKRIGFIGFSLSAKTAVYVGAFAPEIAATVALDPHIAVNGSTNWYAPWYLDWMRPIDGIPTKEKTPLSMLNPDAARPGFEHDHHELLALAAPRPFLLIGGTQKEDNAGDSDDLQSWGYVNRAREVYRLLGVEDRLGFASTNDGHKATGPNIDPAWQEFFERWLKGIR